MEQSELKQLKLTAAKARLYGVQMVHDAASGHPGGIADFGSVDPQWLEGLSTSPIFTDLSSRYRQALILSQIPDFLLCAALTAGGFLLARWLRRKYRTA